MAAAAITVTTLHELQRSDPRWLERFTLLDNATRSETGDPHVPRTVAAMNRRIGFRPARLAAG